MEILTGSIANPINVLKRAPYPVVEGRLVSATVQFVPIVAKLLPETQCAIELVCGWLAAAIGLPVPRVGVATIRESILRPHVDWPYERSTANVFICAFIPAQKVVSLDSPVIDERLRSWRFAELAGVFDELIANDDRSKGNILFDARGDFWLIDHARALGGAGERLFSTEFFPAFENYFLGRIARENARGRYERKQTLLYCCAQIRAHVSRVPYSELGVSSELETEMRQYLSARMRNLEQLVLYRANITDLLIDAEHQPKSH
jgi:hypothetical protein